MELLKQVNCTWDKFGTENIDNTRDGRHIQYMGKGIDTGREYPPIIILIFFNFCKSIGWAMGEI